jgi:hypothetical protein
MGMIAVRISDRLKQEMDRVHINWSDYLRKSIEEAVASRHKRTLIQKIHRTLGGFNSTKHGTAARIIRSIRRHA